MFYITTDKKIVSNTGLYKNNLISDKVQSVGKFPYFLTTATPKGWRKVLEKCDVHFIIVPPEGFKNNEMKSNTDELVNSFLSLVAGRNDRVPYITLPIEDLCSFIF